MKRRDSDKDNILASSCPRCGYRMDTATAIDDTDKVRPSPGDFSVCMRCGQTLRFDEDMEPVLCLDEELSELTPKQMERIRHAQRLIREGWGAPAVRRARQ